MIISQRGRREFTIRSSLLFPPLVFPQLLHILQNSGALHMHTSLCPIITSAANAFRVQPLLYCGNPFHSFFHFQITLINHIIYSTFSPEVVNCTRLHFTFLLLAALEQGCCCRTVSSVPHNCLMCESGLCSTLQAH